MNSTYQARLLKGVCFICNDAPLATKSMCTGCAQNQREYAAGRKAERQESRLKSRFGLSLQQYRNLLQGQNGGCAICHSTEFGSRTKTLAVDHNHSNGKIRGLLCDKCNRGLGMFNDSPELLKVAANYLTQSGA